MSDKSASKILNLNVGILGHVDSGKTSLARALSTVGSTAAFDKNPQSKERGITLDLGFSSFSLPVEEKWKERDPELSPYETVQITLVDCPGHASLFKTVIGGSQVIDLVVLVIDVGKGFQTQTAECLLLAQITTPGKMILAANKVDTLDPAKKETHLQKLEKRVRKTLETTSFATAPFVPVSARPGGGDSAENQPASIDSLLETLKASLFVPSRSDTGPFLYAVDHCFMIKGQGTVLTGTVLSGSISVSDSVEIPSMGVVKKVKSIQVFRKPVNKVSQGDRCGLCVTQLDSKQLERGLICQLGTLPPTFAAVVTVQTISYFKAPIKSKGRFHTSIGYETVMGRYTFFSGEVGSEKEFHKDRSYRAIDFVRGAPEDVKKDLVWDEKSPLFALVEFESPVICPEASVYIASRLDTEINSPTCRLAFHGSLIVPFHEKTSDHNLSSIRVFKNKRREGTVDRMLDSNTVVVHSLIKKETNREAFVGLKVTLSTGEAGIIDSGFGQSGKLKVNVPSGLQPETQAMLEGLGKKKKSGGDAPKPSNPVKVVLEFRRFMFDVHKKMLQ